MSELAFAMTLQHTSPAEVPLQVFGGQPVKAPHPAFETAVVGVDVLNMESAINDSDALLHIDRSAVLWRQSPCSGDTGVFPYIEL